ncbi:acyl carrier protein [Pseudomonas sp. D3]|uniref:acyl carrier protein n=1 Tax=Pseudomonas sp. D3 TaxID=517398 RepID=UPI0023E43BA7|nr:acyl carrier protein [Pseudomonas sp. D3]WET12370.1 acyl carrier protein [Pseudomonas sp. D3]
MNETILRLIEESMEADENTISFGQQLDWDSIAIVTFMALVDERLGKTISADRLNKCETVDQVVELVAA